MLRSVFILFCWQSLFCIKFVFGHHNWAIRHSENPMKEFSGKYGVMVSFEKPVYLNGYFLGFEGWDSINQQFGAENVTFIVRVEFELAGFKENRIKRRFKHFWSVRVLSSQWALQFFLAIHGGNVLEKFGSANTKTTILVLNLWTFPK